MNINKIDFIRQQQVLNPVEFNLTNYRIDVIGAGATGSYVVFQLAKMGIKNIHVWDKDVVEPHNLPNQLYGINDIGKFKNDALKDICKNICGIEINTHNEFVDKNTKNLGEIVFLLTDTMKSRKEIVENCFNKCKCCIETRISATKGMIYTFNPSMESDIIKWNNKYYPDDFAEKSECGTTLSMGITSSCIASMAIWQFVKWYKFYNCKDAEMVNKGLVCLPEFEINVMFSPEFRVVSEF